MYSLSSSLNIPSNIPKIFLTCACNDPSMYSTCISKWVMYSPCTHLCTTWKHFVNICDPQFKCYWWIHVGQMLRLQCSFHGAHWIHSANVPNVDIFEGTFELLESGYISDICWGYIQNVNGMYLVGTMQVNSDNEKMWDSITKACCRSCQGWVTS